MPKREKLPDDGKKEICWLCRAGKLFARSDQIFKASGAVYCIACAFVPPEYPDAIRTVESSFR